MTKKNLIIFFISIFLCFKVQPAEDVLNYIKLMQLNLDKNQLEKVEEIFDEHEDLLSKKWMALERLAISFERREKIKEAIEIYRKIIIDFNQVEHDKILITPAIGITENFYNNNKLPLYYYKLAFLNTQLYVKSHVYTPESLRKKYKSSSEGFISLCRKVKVDEGELKLLEEQLLDKITANEKLIYYGSWYGILDIMSWHDQVYLINTTTGASFNLLSTVLGTCIGGGHKWQNSKYEFNIDGCYVMGNSTISSQDNSLKYQQSSIPEKGIIVGPGFYLRMTDNVLLGMQIPFMYRKGDWTVPEATYKFKNNVSFEGGYFLQSKFRVGGLFIRTRFGKIFPNPASHWSIGLLYDF